VIGSSCEARIAGNRKITPNRPIGVPCSLLGRDRGQNHYFDGSCVVLHGLPPSTLNGAASKAKCGTQVRCALTSASPMTISQMSFVLSPN
jgi:hypothetical protein